MLNKFFNIITPEEAELLKLSESAERKRIKSYIKVKSMNTYTDREQLVWILDAIDTDKALARKFRSVLQKEINTNAKRLTKAFNRVNELKALRWDLIVFLRKSGERDFSVCKKITNRIKEIKKRIQALEHEHRFKKILIKTILLK